MPLTSRPAPLPRRLLALGLALGLAAGGALAQSDQAKAQRFYEDALSRFEKRDLPGAIIQLKNALQINKSLLAGRVLLGKALLANGDPVGAEVELNEALRLGVSRAEVAAPLARAMIRQGKQPQMLENPALNPAGISGPARLELLLLRAGAATDVGNAEQALDAIAQAREIAPENPDVWAAEVPVRVRARQLPQAQQAVEQALKLDPRSASAHYQMGTIHHVAARNAAAVKAYDQALALDPGHAEARLARAGLLLDMGQLSKAAADVEQLLKLAPDEPRSLYLSAMLAERNGDAEKAKAALARISALLDPVPIDMIRYRPQALLLIGLAHFGQGQYEKAKPYLEYAYRLQTQYPLAKLLAQVYLAEPAPAKAEEVLITHLRHHPNDAQAKLMLASALMGQGRHGRASTLMREALQGQDAPELRTALGMSLMRSGQGDEAAAELEKSFSRQPSQAYTGLALVTLHLRAGRTEQALQTALKLAKAQPGNPSAQLVLGLARTAGGDQTGAKQAYEQALKLNPGLNEAKMGLARLALLRRDLPEAERRLTEVLKSDDKSVEALMEMAVISEVQRRPQDVQRWLDRAVEVSDNKELRPGLAMVAWHLKQGQPPQALQAARQLVLRAPEDPRVLHVHADALIANAQTAQARNVLADAGRKAGYDAAALNATAQRQIAIQDWNGARYTLEKVLNQQPKDLGANVLMATLDLQAGALGPAEQRARDIVQAHPRRAVGPNLMADIAARKRQAEPALDWLAKAHAAEPSVATLMRLAQARSAAAGSARAAIPLLEGWLKTRPNELAVRKALADARLSLGELPAARAAYETVLKQAPQDVEAMNNLANTMIRQRDAEAVKLAERALSLAPRNAFVLDTAGWAHLQLGDKERALHLLRDARLREPGHPEIRYHLATALLRTGRKDEARAELVEALKVSGDFTGAQEARALLATLN